MTIREVLDPFSSAGDAAAGGTGRFAEGAGPFGAEGLLVLVLVILKMISEGSFGSVIFSRWIICFGCCCCCREARSALLLLVECATRKVLRRGEMASSLITPSPSLWWIRVESPAQLT